MLVKLLFYSKLTCISFRATCLNATDDVYTVSVSFSYPYQPSAFQFSYTPTYNTTSDLQSCQSASGSNALGGAAGFYVFMSVISFLLGIFAVVVYVLLYAPCHGIAKYISLIVSVQKYDQIQFGACLAAQSVKHLRLAVAGHQQVHHAQAKQQGNRHGYMQG